MAEYIPTNSTFVNPYNFIDLIQTLERKFKYKDQKAKGKLTGWLECNLETKTPIFIPNTSKIFMQKVGDGEMKCLDFFSYTDLSKEPTNKKLEDLPQPRPVIPGSEIRGMARSAFEAVTNSCLSTIDDKQILYKRVQSQANIGPARLIYDETKEKWQLQLCERIGIALRETADDKHNFSSVIRTLREGQRVFINKGGKYKTRRGFPAFTVVNDIQTTKIDSSYIEGFFHQGERFGNRKHHESVFVPTGKFIDDIGETAVRNLLDNFVLYRDKTVNTHLKKKGEHTGYNHIGKLEHLEDLHKALVYCTEHAGNYYLCPAAIGREVFYNKLTDLIGSFTPCTQIDHVCETCALFGIAGKEEAAVSRVRFTDAVVRYDEQGQKLYAFESPTTLKELASPKLSATEFYLKKPPKADLWNYDYAINWKTAKDGLAKYQPEIRGRKFYWHQQNPNIEYQGELSDRLVHVRPLSKDSQFSFKVYFNQITQEELHKLLWVLEIGGRDTHAHKIGMGKPIGLGSIAIRVERIVQRQIQLRDGSVQYAITDIKKPDYAEIEQQRFTRHTSILQEFLTITDFANAPKPVSYPCNEDTPETYVWFMANKVVAPGARGTTPIIEQVLPELSYESPLLKKYRVADNRAGSKYPRSDTKPASTGRRTGTKPVHADKKADSSEQDFDLSRVRIETKYLTVNALLKMIQSGQLLLERPSYIDQKNRWSETDESLFIESFMLQVPQSPLHLVIAENNTWQVVDGLQRLKALKRFVSEKNMTLTGLRSLTQFEGKTITELPGSFYRKITDTQMTIRLIEKRTPQAVIFKMFYQLKQTR